MKLAKTGQPLKQIERSLYNFALVSLVFLHFEYLICDIFGSINMYITGIEWYSRNRLDARSLSAR